MNETPERLNSGRRPKPGSRPNGLGFDCLAVGTEGPSICAKKAHDDRQRLLTATKGCHLPPIGARPCTRVSRKSSGLNVHVSSVSFAKSQPARRASEASNSALTAGVTLLVGEKPA